MHGTISFLSFESAWKGLVGFGDKVSRVSIGGGLEYTLRCSSGGLRHSVRYVISDVDEKIVDEREMVFGFLKTTLDLSLSGHYPMEYLIGFLGRRYFVSPNEKVRTFFKVSGGVRSLSVDGMTFEHRDFQSVMHFRCEDDRMIQAILVASLLFDPPLQNEGDL